MKFHEQIIVYFILFSALIVFIPSDLQADEDVAVPAVADFAGIGIPQAGLTNQYATSPYASGFRMLDINKDMKLNDFDIKHFQSIVESLNAEDSTGLQLASRFRIAQKNQRESFPDLYDIDRDGIFSPSDVDSFSGIVNEFDEGATKGKELIRLFRLRVYPHKSAE